jgi:chromosome segregation ATPase
MQQTPNNLKSALKIIQALENENKKLKENFELTIVKDLNNQISILHSELKQISSAKSSIEEKYSSLNHKILELTAENTNLKEETAKMVLSFEVLRQEKKIISDKLRILKDSLRAAKPENTKVKPEVSFLQSRVHENTKSGSKSTEKYKQLQDSLNTNSKGLRIDNKTPTKSKILNNKGIQRLGSMVSSKSQYFPSFLRNKKVRKSIKLQDSNSISYSKLN